MTTAGSLAWFAHHELRLSWRDFARMMHATRSVKSVVAIVAFVVLMHVIAYAVVGRFADVADTAERADLVVIAAGAFLTWLLLLSQGIESATRVLYTRSDLDVIMSSPVELSRVVCVRLAAVALTVTLMAALVTMPFVDVLVWIGGARWLSALGTIVAGGLSASAVAIALTMLLFRLIGESRTRLVAQIVAAVVGAGFVIGLQIVAVTSYDTMSRMAALTSDLALSLAPGDGSLWWLPARAITGDVGAMSILLAASFMLLGASIAWLGPQFGIAVGSASGRAGVNRAQRQRPFRKTSRQHALLRKELRLLRRDPWLVSQTLMQLLYLLPPAVMLWHGFGDSAGLAVVLPPVLVMAAGQLAGGVAWLTVSGEEAPDLVESAPIAPSRIAAAKVETVLLVIALVFAPLVAAIFFLSPLVAGVTALGILLAAASATAIQFWFRVRAKRSQFRRRQTASRVATFAEAFSSIGWAATAGVVLAFPIAGVITAALTLGLLVAARKMSPAAKKS